MENMNINEEFKQLMDQIKTIQKLIDDTSPIDPETATAVAKNLREAQTTLNGILHTLH